MPNMKPVKTFYSAYVIYDNEMSLCSIWLSFLCCRELFILNASYEDSGDSLIYNGIHILLFMIMLPRSLILCCSIVVILQMCSGSTAGYPVLYKQLLGWSCLKFFSRKNEHRFLLDEFDLQTCAVVDSLNYCREWI